MTSFDNFNDALLGVISIGNNDWGNPFNGSIDEVMVLSDEEDFSSEYLHTLAYFQKVTGKDTVGIKISSVTEDYSYFVEGIQNIANQSGNPFDMSGPPANAIGNIQGGDALGYFKVSYVSYKESRAFDMRDVEKKNIPVELFPD